MSRILFSSKCGLPPWSGVRLVRAVIRNLSFSGGAGGPLSPGRVANRSSVTLVSIGVTGVSPRRKAGGMWLWVNCLVSSSYVGGHWMSWTVVVKVSLHPYSPAQPQLQAFLQLLLPGASRVSYSTSPGRGKGFWFEGIKQNTSFLHY